MADIFISYARADQAAVRRLADALRAEGYSVWWDEELPPHRAYGDVIAEQIGAARAAIVVWSESASASDWVRAEADLARNQKKLIQVALDARQPPMPFNQIHATPMGDWRGEADHLGWRMIRESLAALTGAPYPMPTAPPPRAAVPTPRGWDGLLIGVMAISLLVLAGVALLAWSRRAEPPPQPVAASTAQPTAPPPIQRQPVNPRLRRHCMGPGRGTPQCRRLRAQHRN